MKPLIPQDPPTVGPYRLLARLGSGGMGVVFLGRAPSGRMVAVKLVHPMWVHEPDFHRRFRAEVEALRRVPSTWTAPVLDYDTESAEPWVTTAYMAGPSLYEAVHTLHGPLRERSAWALARGLALALTDIHAAGLIHRDLKPSNVLLTLDGPKVIDFGIARSVDASALTRTGEQVGTPNYMSPEQARCEDLTNAADVFSLGALLSFAVTGVAPFSGGLPQAVLYRVVHEPPQLGPDSGRLRDDLRELVHRCLAKEAGERPTPGEIAALANEHLDDAFWLPQDLAVKLGRDAADLLGFEGPLSEQPLAAGEPEPHASPSEPPVAPDQTTYVSRALGARGTPTRRRRGRLLIAGALALAVTASLLIIGNPLDDAGGGDPTKTAGDTPNAAGSATQRDAVLPQAPLSHLVPQDVRDAGGLTVHFADREKPVLFMEEGKGTPSGFEADLVREIGKQLGVEVRFAVSAEPSYAADAAIRKGAEVAAHIALAGFPDNSEDREQLGVDFVNHFVDGWAVVSDEAGFTGAFGELCGRTVTTYDSEFMQEVVRENTEACPEPVDITAFPSRDDMAEAIQSGEVDAAVLLYSMAGSYLGEHPDSGLRVALAKRERGTRGIAVPLGQPELRDALLAAVGAVLENGTYQKLLERWNIPQAGIKRPAVNTGA